MATTRASRLLFGGAACSRSSSASIAATVYVKRGFSARPKKQHTRRRGTQTIHHPSIHTISVEPNAVRSFALGGFQGCATSRSHVMHAWFFGEQAARSTIFALTSLEEEDHCKNGQFNASVSPPQVPVPNACVPSLLDKCPLTTIEGPKSTSCIHTDFNGIGSRVYTCMFDLCYVTYCSMDILECRFRIRKVLCAKSSPFPLQV